MRVWDAASGTALGEPLTGHTDGVRAVALGRVGDRDVIVSGSWDETVRIWDAASGTACDTIDLDAPVWTVALQPGLLCVAAGSSICLLRSPTSTSLSVP